MQKICCSLAALLVSLPASAFPAVTAPQARKGASISSATVVGTVVDPTGARVPGATITLQAGSLTRTATADAAGTFTMHLPAGTYAVTAAASGFTTLQSGSITLRAGVHLTLPLTLALNSTATTVTVNSSTSPETTDEADNRTALVLGGPTLNTLSDDDQTFQQQIQALAGGGDTGTANIYVDGFSGGTFPPKNAIREIRINSNPLSAEYEDLGFGRIEIFTKPGSNNYHGRFDLRGTYDGLNARNPYDVGAQPGYHDLYFNGNVSGPLGKKSSFFAYGQRIDQQNNTVVNAVTGIPGSAATTPVSEAVPDPETTSSASARLDRQVTENNVLTGRYEWNASTQTNSGVGQLVLPSEGVTDTTTHQTLQLSDTQTQGANTVIETRFEYIRTRLRQTPNSTAPTLVVQGTFSGGGSSSQSETDNQDHYEWIEYISHAAGKQFFRFGGRLRSYRESNTSTAGYNGTFTYAELTYNPAADGAVDNSLATGLPSQVSITEGTPSAEVSTLDYESYGEDEWKISKNLTGDFGFRFEGQTAIPGKFNPAPRLGFAYALQPGTRKEPLVVFRTGFGMFYDRFQVGNLLTAVRQNGILQRSFLQNDAAVPYCNTFGCLGTSLGALGAVSPTIYRVSPNLKTEYAMIGVLSAEHSFGEKGSVSATYYGVRGDDQYLSRNINAPLPGTYNPADPASGVRPLGGTQNIYEFESEGNRRGQIFFADVDLQPTRHLSVWAWYKAQQREADSSGATSFPTNQYDLAQDYGRSAVNTQNLSTGLWYEGRHGLSGGLFFNAHSGVPFDITTGTDLNGDTQFNDRPAFATDLTRASVVRTRYGNFDTNPMAGQTLIPNNYATGPAFSTLQLSLSKWIGFGAKLPYTGPPPAPGVKPEPPDTRYHLRFGIEAQNVFNQNNPGTPVGVLTSPYFGESISLASGYNSITAANRVLNLRTTFSF